MTITQTDVDKANEAIQTLANDGRPFRVFKATRAGAATTTRVAFSEGALLVRYRATEIEDEIHRGITTFIDAGAAQGIDLLEALKWSRVSNRDLSIEDLVEQMRDEQERAPKHPWDIDDRTFECEGERVVIETHRYQHGKSVAIRLTTMEGALYATLTLNLDDVVLPDHQVAIKSWSGNEDIAAAALASGIFERTGMRMPTGHVQAEIWEITGGRNNQRAASNERTR